MKRQLLFLLSFLMSSFLFAQVNTVQPSVMVIPFVPEGVDIRSTLDMSNAKRQVIAQISGAFADKGYPPKDFYATFKAVSQKAEFESGNQRNLKSQIIEASGADIFVEADVSVNGQSDGNSVRVVLKAYEASTAKVLASKIGDSGKFYTTDVGKLGAKAVEKAMDGFLTTMQQQFDDMIVNGKSIVLNIGFDEMSEFDTKSEVGNSGDELCDVIEDWIADNAYKNYYHVQGVTRTEMIFDEVRIPLKDASGRNYSTRTFLRGIKKLFRELGINIDDDTQGGTIYISIK